MKNLVVFGKGVNYFFAKEGYINEAEQLIKEYDTIEEAQELSNHLNRVLRGERLKFIRNLNFWNKRKSRRNEKKIK